MTAEHTQGGGLGRTHLRVIADGRAESLSAAAQATIATGSRVQNDDWSGRVGLGSFGCAHLPRIISTGVEVDAWLPWSHIVL